MPPKSTLKKGSVRQRDVETSLYRLNSISSDILTSLLEISLLGTVHFYGHRGGGLVVFLNLSP